MFHCAMAYDILHLQFDRGLRWAKRVQTNVKTFSFGKRPSVLGATIFGFISTPSEGKEIFNLGDLSVALFEAEEISVQLCAIRSRFLHISDRVVA